MDVREETAVKGVLGGLCINIRDTWGKSGKNMTDQFYILLANSLEANQLRSTVIYITWVLLDFLLHSVGTEIRICYLSISIDVI